MGLHRDTLDIPGERITHLEPQVLGKALLDRNRDVGRPGRNAPDKTSRCQRLGWREGATVGRSILSPERPSRKPLAAVLQELLGGFPADRRQFHGDDRRLFHDRGTRRGGDGVEGGYLIVLDVKEDEVRAPAGLGPHELPEERRSREEEGQDQEGPQSQGQEKQDGAVVGPVKVGDTLTHHVGQAAGNPVPGGPGDRGGQPTEDAEAGREDGGEAEPDPDAARLPDREGDHGDDNDHDQEDAVRIGGSPDLLREGGAQRDERRHLADRQERKQRKQNADHQTRPRAPEDRGPGERDGNVEGQDPVQKPRHGPLDAHPHRAAKD